METQAGHGNHQHPEEKAEEEGERAEDAAFGRRSCSEMMPRSQNIG